MSRFNHSICDRCWRKREGEREPVRLVDRVDEICCFCGERHKSGISIAASPATTLCRGDHGQLSIEDLVRAS